MIKEETAEERRGEESHDKEKDSYMKKKKEWTGAKQRQKREEGRIRGRRKQM